MDNQLRLDDKTLKEFAVLLNRCELNCMSAIQNEINKFHEETGLTVQGIAVEVTKSGFVRNVEFNFDIRQI